MTKKRSWLVKFWLILSPLQFFAQNNPISFNDSIIIKYREHGTGPAVLGKKYISTHHTIKTADGRKLRDTYKTGQVLIMKLHDTIGRQYWIKTLEKLRVGDEVKITIPDSIAYKNWRAFFPTKPFKAFPIFIEMLVLAADDELPPDAEIVMGDFGKKMPDPFDIEGKDTIKLKSGLQYIIVYDNPVGDQAYNGREVKVDYTGYFTDGTIFETSYLNEQPFTFTLTRGEVIAGWDEGIRLMKTGDKFRFIIPPKLGYGNKEQGLVPPNTTLIFDVELISVK